MERSSNGEVDDARSEWEFGIVGGFATAKNAFSALHALHAKGWNRTWIGFFRIAPNGGEGPVVDVEWEGNPFDALGVFPMCDGGRRPLREALSRRGVPQEEARSFERIVASGSIVLVVVDANGRIDEGRAILAAHGARLAHPREPPSSRP